MASLAGQIERVFCHACETDWFRTEGQSLTCPNCDSTFTEIIGARTDARDIDGMRLPISGWDSDPEEADILEHIREESPLPGERTNLNDAGLGRFGRMLSGLEPPEPRSPARDQGNGPDLVGGDAILRHFAEMLDEFEATRAAHRPPEADRLFPGGNPLGNLGRTPGTRVQQTTVRTGPFGTQTRVTITSGTVRNGPETLPLPNFGTLFGQLFGSPWVDELDRRERGERQPGSPFGGGLHDLLESLYNPAAAVHGDAVFTQEALDRIISQLMEQSPHTNGAPPASQAAIESLQKKRVDDEMLGADGKAECTICMDEISKGAEVTVLPCNHWYHGECVVLWLREHNTCPVCRMSIDNREGASSSNNARRGSQQAQNPPQSSQQAQSSRPGSDPPSSSNSSSNRFSRTRGRYQDDLERIERLERINSLRNPPFSAERHSESFRDPRRRNSHSPPNPWSSPEAASSSRLRGYRAWPGTDYGEHYGGGGRRGTERDQREGREQQQGNAGSTPGGSNVGGGGGGGGPLGWFREHFGGGRRS